MGCVRVKKNQRMDELRKMGYGTNTKTENLPSLNGAFRPLEGILSHLATAHPIDLEQPPLQE